MRKLKTIDIFYLMLATAVLVAIGWAGVTYNPLFIKLCIIPLLFIFGVIFDPLEFRRESREEK
jgi:hypothetical protein